MLVSSSGSTPPVVFALSVVACVACGAHAPSAGTGSAQREVAQVVTARPSTDAARPASGEAVRAIPAATGVPDAATPLVEVHASLGPAEHRHIDGKIAGIEQLIAANGWRRFRILIDGKVTRDAPTGGTTDDMPQVDVEDQSFEVRLPTGVSVAMAVGQRLRGSLIAGADARPGSTRVLLFDDVGPVVALRETPDGFVLQAGKMAASTQPSIGPRRVHLSATWPAIKTIAVLDGCSAWGIEQRSYVLCGYGEVAAAAAAPVTIVFALLRQPQP